MLRVAESFHVTDTGRHRQQNEDRWFARAPLFGVADGMGGGPAGEVAAQIAVDVLDRGLPDGSDPPEERLARLVLDANAQIHDHSNLDAKTAGMGTTMTTAWLGEHELSIAHVGDSRLYCLRDGQLERLTRDHSLVEDMIQEGRLTEEEAEGHPQRSIVTRIVGAFPDVMADHFTWTARDGDVYLICSDGLTDMVREARVRELLLAAESLREAGRSLVEAANAGGGRDNITAVLFRVEEIGEAPEEATMVGAITTADVRAALAEQPQAAGRATDPRADATVERRVPLPPPGGKGKRRKKPKKDRTRSATILRTLGFFAVFGLPLLLAAFIASQSVYFVGTNDEGFVTLYRGLPYELPAGVNLYSKNYVSGVSTGQLGRPVQGTVRSHELRSREDGEDLVRQIEQGRVAGQGSP